MKGYPTPFQQHFMVEGKYLGSAMRSVVPVHGTLQPPRPYAFFCGSCADIWARCPIDKAANLVIDAWMVWTLPCRKCTGSKYQIPGSITMYLEPEFCDAFPDAVLRWEFDRHLDYAERNLLWNSTKPQSL